MHLFGRVNVTDKGMLYYYYQAAAAVIATQPNSIYMTNRTARTQLASSLP